MASRRGAGIVASQAGLFACGAALPPALHSRLYPASAVLALTRLWIANDAVLRARPPLERQVPPAQDDADAGAQTRLLASLLDQTPAPLLTRDRSDVVQARNRAARVLFRTDDRVLDPPADLLEALRAGSGPGRLTAGVGEAAARRTYAVSLSDLATAEGPLRLAVLLDIEPDIRTAEASTLRELMQVLSHEIMNALTPVASLAATAQDLLADGSPAAASQAAEAVGVLARRAEGLARFADSYRAMARLPPPTLAPVSLTALADEAARLFRSRWAGVELRVSPPQPDIRMELDADQIMPAVLNLLSNAAEAAREAAAEPQVALSVASARDGGVRLSVTDNGPGVDEADAEQVFKPFFTTKATGTGVGLSFARQVARGHGGDLVLLDPAPGRGAQFEMRL